MSPRRRVPMWTWPMCMPSVSMKTSSRRCPDYISLFRDFDGKRLLFANPGKDARRPSCNSPRICKLMVATPRRSARSAPMAGSGPSPMHAATVKIYRPPLEADDGFCLAVRRNGARDRASKSGSSESFVTGSRNRPS